MTSNDGRPTSPSAGNGARRLAALLAVPLVLVNASAMWGQAGWAEEHITEPAWPAEVRWLVAVLFAVAVESVGVYLAGMAHAALMADQSAGMLRFGSYVVGLLVGLLNYWHFAGSLGHPTEQAVVFGALSSISPWLWSIYSRYRNRDRLAAMGLVDVRGVKLSTSRKFWHPALSVKVMSYAAWKGITDPADAVAQWEASQAPTPNQPATDWIPAEIVDEDAPMSDRERDDIWERFGNGRKPGSWEQVFGPPAEQVDTRQTEPAIESNTRTAVASTSRNPVNEAIDQVERDNHPRRPGRPPEKTDDELVSEHGTELRDLRAAGKLTRWRVERLTGAGKNQALRLIGAIEDELTPWVES